MKLTREVFLDAVDAAVIDHVQKNMQGVAVEDPLVFHAALMETIASRVMKDLLRTLGWEDLDKYLIRFKGKRTTEEASLVATSFLANELFEYLPQMYLLSIVNAERPPLLIAFETEAARTDFQREMVTQVFEIWGERDESVKDMEFTWSESTHVHDDLKYLLIPQSLPAAVGTLRPHTIGMNS